MHCVSGAVSKLSFVCKFWCAIYILYIHSFLHHFRRNHHRHGSAQNIVTGDSQPTAARGQRYPRGALWNPRRGVIEVKIAGGQGPLTRSHQKATDLIGHSLVGGTDSCLAQIGAHLWETSLDWVFIWQGSNCWIYRRCIYRLNANSWGLGEWLDYSIGVLCKGAYTQTHTITVNKLCSIHKLY